LTQGVAMSTRDHSSKGVLTRQPDHHWGVVTKIGIGVSSTSSPPARHPDTDEDEGVAVQIEQLGSSGREVRPSGRVPLRRT